MSVPGRQLPSDTVAASLRGMGPLGIAVVFLVVLSGNIFVGSVMVPLGALLVLLWAWASRTPWHRIGYARPRSWAGSVLAGIALGIALKLLLKAVVMPLLGAEPVNQAYHHLAGNRAMLPAAVWAMVIAGFAEEAVFRGYLFERLGQLFGSSLVATIVIVLLTSLGFGLSHYVDQGLAGAAQGTIVGIVFGTIFAATGRIWAPMCAHAAFNLTALAIIYWDIETEVAGFFFG